MTREDAHNRLRQVRDRLAAARFAVRHTLDTWEVPRGAMQRDDRGSLTRTGLAAAADDLDLTYVVRLVAAFEGILKDYREIGLKKKPARVDLEPLINLVARRRDVDPRTLAGAHAVRDYRNDIVHRGPSGAAAQLRDLRRRAGQVCGVAALAMVMRLE